MSSSTLSSFWKEHASATRSGNSRTTSATTSSGLIVSTTSASGSRNRLAATEQHLLQGVAAQPEPQRLEWDHLVGRDVAEVDVRAEMLDEPRLALLGWR